MREVICPTCGAINHADSDTCWRCLAAVPATRPAAASAGREHQPSSSHETRSTRSAGHSSGHRSAGA